MILAWSLCCASLQSDLTSAGFDLPIPPLVSAQLELTFPQDSPTIELPMARGQIRVNRDRGQLSADLGACNRLAVRWPAGIGTEGAAANLEVEELIWIRMRPGTTILDAKFKYHLIAGRMSRVRLLADPRLRLLPTNTANSPVTAVHTVPGNPQRIDLELSRSMSDQVVIELSFLLTGTSGVGNLRLPRLEASGVRPIKRLAGRLGRSSGFSRNKTAKTPNRWTLANLRRPGVPATHARRRPTAFRAAKRCGPWRPSPTIRKSAWNKRCR